MSTNEQTEYAVTVQRTIIITRTIVARQPTAELAQDAAIMDACTLQGGTPADWEIIETNELTTLDEVSSTA